MSEEAKETTEVVTEPTTEAKTENAVETAPKELFTPEQQKYVDGIITARLAREKEKYEGKIEKSVEKTAEEVRAEYETKLVEAQKVAVEAQEKAQQTLFSSAVTVAAVTAGVDPANVALFSRMVGLDEVTAEDGTIDSQKVSEAVSKAISAFPAAKGSAGVGGSPASSTTTEPESLSMYEAVMKQLG